jgi:hypothetical protein
MLWTAVVSFFELSAIRSHVIEFSCNMGVGAGVSVIRCGEKVD